MKCIGLLENDFENENILPENWSQDIDGVFSFKYKSDNDIIYLKLIYEGNILDINMLNKNKNDIIFDY